ncbi:MAG: Wzz/FepE/Etk N-terminal domain-containing protein [Bacteroidota bacterium]
MNTREQTSFDSTHLLLFIWKWRKTLIVITLIAAVTSAVISLMIPNKYKSAVILYPTTTSSISKALLSDNPSAKNDILQFGEEAEAEQMIQVLTSDDIMWRITDKYKLMSHYRIDSTSPFRKTFLAREFQSNVVIQRTEYMSVKIEVLDEDPQYAANIANDIADLYDTTKQAIRKERAQQGLRIVEETYNKLRKEVETMQDSLNVLMKLGVNDYESQSDRLNEAISKAILEGKTAAVKILQEQLKIVSTYGEAYISLRDNLEFVRKNLSEVKAKYEQAKVDAEQSLSDKFVVNRAYPSEKKSYPVRWLIVTVSTLSTFLLCILGIIIIENFWKIKQSVSPRE